LAYHALDATRIAEAVAAAAGAWLIRRLWANAGGAIAR
jgi:hypothetical protein